MTKNKDFYCVILAGGIGSRFWPMSTSQLPKQFHDILGTGKTLVQQTFERLNKIILQENIFIITNEEYIELTLSQLPHLSREQVIGESKMMNTAACNVYMAEKIFHLNPNATIVVAPSDHLILDNEAFMKNVLLGMDRASKEDILVTLGIQPTRPDTGYGYIEFETKDVHSLHKVESFKEKPDLETAKIFIESKKFLWNSGIFIWSAQSILKSFSAYLPDMYQSFKNIQGYNTNEEKQEVDEIYPTLQKISIDYGILEKSDNVWVIPSSFGWSDLGTWGALYENFNKDDEGNVLHGNYIYTYNTVNTIVKTARMDKIFIVDGLTDYIVVDTDNALLICPKNKDQKIKEYLDDIKNSGIEQV